MVENPRTTGTQVKRAVLKPADIDIKRAELDMIIDEMELNGLAVRHQLSSTPAGEVVLKAGINAKFMVRNCEGSYQKFLEKVNEENQPSTTNIHAENVAYTEGDNNGNQSFSSKNKNKTIANSDDTNTMRNLVVSIVGGVVVGLILFYIFGIGG